MVYGRKQASMYVRTLTYFHNAVLLVWGSLRFTPNRDAQPAIHVYAGNKSLKVNPKSSFLLTGQERHSSDTLQSKNIASFPGPAHLENPALLSMQALAQKILELWKQFGKAVGTMHMQGVVTPIGSILKAATRDTTKSSGHGGFLSSVTESQRFSRRLKTVTGSKASRFKRNARDLFYFIYAVVTRTHAILRCGHGVTAKFRVRRSPRSQP